VFICGFIAFAFSVSLGAQESEPSTGTTAKHAVIAKKYMVVAAHPLAVDAGLAMLERGGSAADALVAVQLVLGLVEPQSSGLGGGSYLLYYDARHRKLTALDGRETAPGEATADLFMRDGKPLSFQQARVGGRSVGTPGTPRLLEVAHARFGKLPWGAPFQPAIALAEKGFTVTPRFSAVAAFDAGLADEPAARAYLFDAERRPVAAGTTLRNPAYAQTLRALAHEGADAFYRGPIARDIVAAVRGHRNPGALSEDDLATYRVRDVDPLCAPYRAWRVCGMPLSSSGGITVLQALGMLATLDVAAMRPLSSEAVHTLAEAERLAFADRNRYLGDDRFVEVPVAGMLDGGYLAERARLIRPERSLGIAPPGVPRGARVETVDAEVEEPMGTSHLVIVDGEGNIATMTSSVEYAYGSRILVRGFFLNNQLTDFAFAPRARTGEVANRVAPGKRPLSSMAPLLVFDRAGDPEMALGGAGGTQIITQVLKALVAALDWRRDVQSAVALPNFGSRNGPTEVERGTELEALVPALKSMGHEVRSIEMTSGLHAIRRAAGEWQGGADPRREGIARGQ
jgi:gamma-glutamyltranspeptidase/glutathione hydrolase